MIDIVLFLALTGVFPISLWSLSKIENIVNLSQLFFLSRNGGEIQVIANGKLIRAPLSQATCVFYYLSFEMEMTSVGSSVSMSTTYWLKRIKTAGQLLVNSKQINLINDAYVDIKPSYKENSGNVINLSEKAFTVLPKDFARDYEVSHNRIKIKEKIIEPGSQVYLIGKSLGDEFVAFYVSALNKEDSLKRLMLKLFGTAPWFW